MDVRIANFTTAVLIVVLAILATDAGAEEKIYKWVDENGAVHFGDMPPDNTAAEQVRVVPDAVSAAPVESAAPADTQPSYVDQLREERATARKEREAQQQELAKQCEAQQKLVSELEPSPRVLVQMKDGTVARLDDHVRLKTLEEAQAFIDANCKKKDK